MYEELLGIAKEIMNSADSRKKYNIFQVLEVSDREVVGYPFIQITDALLSIDIHRSVSSWKPGEEICLSMPR